MKNLFILLTSFLIFSACGKDDLLPPVNNTNPYVNKYAGNYSGVFHSQTSGVDSNGVFKSDSSYSYVVKVLDAGNYKISISGLDEINSIEVDSNGYFNFEDYNRSITGWFKEDSLHIDSKSLNGSSEPPLWFSIVNLEFNGKKIP